MDVEAPVFTALIRTDRSVLRPYHAGMVTDQHVAWLNDPEVVRYSEQRHKRHTLETQHSYVNGVWSNPGSWIWLICKPTPLDAIGTITAHCDENNKVANMGILIGEKTAWGQGYGSEAWAAVMKWLFKERGMRKVEAGFAAPNRAMREACLNSEMFEEGERREHFMLNGKPESLIQYSRFA